MYIQFFCCWIYTWYTHVHTVSTCRSTTANPAVCFNVYRLYPPIIMVWIISDVLKHQTGSCRIQLGPDSISSHVIRSSLDIAEPGDKPGFELLRKRAIVDGALSKKSRPSAANIILLDAAFVHIFLHFGSETDKQTWNPKSLHQNRQSPI